MNFLKKPLDCVQGVLNQQSNCILGIPGLPSKTSYFNVDAPINAFASSKDGSQLAVAGRSG